MLAIEPPALVVTFSPGTPNIETTIVPFVSAATKSSDIKSLSDPASAFVTTRICGSYVSVALAYDNPAALSRTTGTVTVLPAFETYVSTETLYADA